MATLYPRKNLDGSITWYLNWTENTSRHRVSLGKVSQANAEIALKAKELELATGTIFFSSSPTLSSFTPEYLSWYVTRYPDSYERVEVALRLHLLPFFGSLPLDQVTEYEVEKFFSYRRNHGASVGTMNKELSILKALINRAIAWDRVSDNPIHGFKDLKSLNSIPRRVYTNAELRNIYASAEGTQHIYWWQLIANTGLRRGEAAQLRWDHVRDGSLHIQSTPTARTKSGKWRRVPLNGAARAALTKLRIISTNDFVFGKVKKSSISQNFKRCLNRATILAPHGSVHSLRHTFITRMVEGGVPLKVVQKIAGHACYRTTESYVQLSDASLDAAVDRISL